MAQQFDLKIVNGTVVDGTGAAPRAADIGVKGGRIVAVEPGLAGDAARIVDAGGHIVTPGFVDIHTHYDGQISWDADLAPSVYHGVTTAVLGSCGVGFAPCRASDRQRLIELMEGVEDIPGTALSEGIKWAWETFPEYMDALETTPRTIDYALHVPHDAVRVFVMGDRALADEPATDADIAAMRDLVREALAAGAVGFSTGRSDNHRSVDGAATPASEADARELAGIAEALDGLPHGTLQAVSDFDINDGKDEFEGEFDVLEAMARAGKGKRMSVSLIQRNRDTEQWRKIMRRAEAATAAGFPIKLQVGARGIGVLLGLQATFHPFMGHPSYKAISHLPLAEQVAELSKPEVRARLLAEKPDRMTGDGSNLPPMVDEFLANVDFVAMRLFRFKEGFNYEPDRTDSLLAQAYAEKKTVLEVLLDAMLMDGGKELLYFPVFNYANGSLDDVGEMLRHPLALPGLSDGGAHVGTICDASFPTFLLSYWARDRAKDRLPLERVVQMLTADGADHIGFTDRGRIAVGQRADLNIIDHAGLRLDRPRMVEDLPAGGRRLMQDAHGYVATFVAGEQVIADDQLTGQRPGRLVRLGQ